MLYQTYQKTSSVGHYSVLLFLPGEINPGPTKKPMLYLFMLVEQLNVISATYGHVWSKCTKNAVLYCMSTTTCKLRMPLIFYALIV